MALIVLLGIYVGGNYGGSSLCSSLGIPGTGSATATTLDGYPLAKRGLGKKPYQQSQSLLSSGT